VASTHARAMKEMSDSYDRGSAFPVVITSRKRESEKLRVLTQQMVSEPRFNDILHVAVFEGAASLPEAELRKCGYSILIQNCHQPSDFVDPFLEAWHKHQRVLAGGDEASLVGKHILLVEDNQLNQRVAKLLLADLKCEIDVADDGEGALKKLSENAYDLVLMDVGLPDINGLEVTEKFRHAHPDSGLPIIALTAHALVEDKQRCFDAGMDDYAVKPLDADKLKNTIRRWVKQKHVDK
jgi:CheY-like chemotaxis protein